MKKRIYGIEFKRFIGNEYILMSDCFNMFFEEFEIGLSILSIIFNNPMTSFVVERNTIEKTFFDFFSLCPNGIKDKEFDNLSQTFFENYKKELENTAYTAVFGEPLKFNDLDKILPPIENITA